MATASYTLDVAEIIEEAFERASGGTRALKSGYDYKTARRSLGLLMMEWANRGLNLWTFEEGTVQLVAGTANYNLPADTVDLAEVHTRISGIDLPVVRISVSTYASIPNKTSSGRPVQYYIQRSTTTPVLHLWPVPDTNDTLVYWRLRRIQDVGADGAATMDVPFRFVPALIAGLAAQIAQKIPEGTERAIPLMTAYEQAFALAADEDREKATVRFVPRASR